MTKFGIVLSDLHCGHLVGLTHPKWRAKFPLHTITKRNKWYKISVSLWDKFAKDIKSLPPLDFVFWNGDLIEGKGVKSGGVELITSNMQDQCDMAVDVINFVRMNACKKNAKMVSTYGTPYHTTTLGDEWENVIADKAGFDKIGSHEWVDVEGTVFDLKHHIGSSQVPYGRHTAVSRDAIWNELWSLTKQQPRADVIIRSHVHYFVYCGWADKLCMTTPALQGMGSKFGSKRMSGLVDWGFVLFEVKPKAPPKWRAYITQIETQRAKVVKI